MEDRKRTTTTTLRSHKKTLSLKFPYNQALIKVRCFPTDRPFQRLGDSFTTPTDSVMYSVDPKKGMIIDKGTTLNIESMFEITCKIDF